MSMLDSPTVAMPTVTPKRHRKRWGRKRTVLTLVGLLVGLPAIALAATYLWGTITGSTTFLDGARVAVTVQSVGVPTTSANGSVTCAATKTSDSAVALDLKALRQVVNLAQSVEGGSCTVDVLLANAGHDPLSVKAAMTLPQGWTFTAPAALVAPDDTAHLVVTITAAPGNGDTTGATAGAITGGTLSLDIPPTT